MKAVNEFIIVKVNADTEQVGELVIQNIQGDRSEAVAIKGRIVDMAEDLKTSLKIGQTVYCMKWEAQKIFLNGEEHIAVKKEHIILVGDSNAKKTSKK